MNWQPIDTYKMPTEQELWNGIPSVLVDNGERIGEATLKEDYSLWEGEGPVPMSWGWTHHSTCGCCYGPMNPQPTHWAPMPTRS